MVAISLVGIVAGMIYLYNIRGWKVYNKAMSFGILQSEARAALSQMARNIKLSSSDLIFTGTAYNSNIPLPTDAIYGKPYIYFAIPRKQEYKAQELKSRESTIITPNYDYYLYYIGKAKNRDGDVARDRARLKLFRILDVDGFYTLENAKKWPILPPRLLGATDYLDANGISLSGAVRDVEYKDISAEFSLYQSAFSFNYFNSNYDKLFSISVNMIDTLTNTKVDFETSVTPRN